MPFGTTWADDTCVLLAGEASSIDSRIAEAFSSVHSALLRHGLSPSYGHGKTSVLVCYRGRESAKYHKRRFAASEPQIPCLVEHGNSVQLAVSQTYRHLGSVVDGDSLLPEVRTRGAMALQAIKPLAKSCLSNWQIPLRRRQQILASLGISVLCHNVGTWRRLNEQEYTAWVSAIWKLYNCMYRNGQGSDYHRRTIEHVALSAGAFAPDALLHVCRLRLFANLLAAPDDLLPRAVEVNLVACGAAPERSWFGCLQAALDWLEATVGQATLIAGLRALQPLDLLAARGDLAKGLKRALHQAVSAHQLQLQMIVDLVDADDWIQKELVDSGWTCRVPSDQQAERARYRCPDCSASFKGEAHLATHRQRVHQQYVAARSFVLSSRCPACKKDFHTRPRALKHVQYQSTRCLPWLLEHGIPVSDDLARSLDAADAAKLCEERRSGIRSKETRMPVDTTHACAPPQVSSDSDVLLQPVVLQGYDKIAGDQIIFIEKWRNYADGPWTLQEEDWAAFSGELTGAFQQCPVETLESFKGEVCDLVEEISWRQDDYEEVNRVLESLYGVAKNFWVPQRSRAPPPETPYERLRRLEARFGSLPAWMGLRDHTTRNGFGRPGHSNVFVHLAALERRWRGEVRLWDPLKCLPHGRSSRNASTWYSTVDTGGRETLRRSCGSCEHPVMEFPICLDLCIHKELGDLLCPTQQSPWMHRMRQKQVNWGPRFAPVRNIYRCSLASSSWRSRETSSPQDLGSSLGSTWFGSSRTSPVESWERVVLKFRPILCAGSYLWVLCYPWAPSGITPWEWQIPNLEVSFCWKASAISSLQVGPLRTGTVGAVFLEANNVFDPSLGEVRALHQRGLSVQWPLWDSWRSQRRWRMAYRKGEGLSGRPLFGDSEGCHQFCQWTRMEHWIQVLWCPGASAHNVWTFWSVQWRSWWTNHGPRLLVHLISLAVKSLP